MTCSFDRKVRRKRAWMDVGLGGRRYAVGLLLTVLMGFARPVTASIRVVTTTPGYADIVKQIGGSRVKVMSVMRGPENSHNVPPGPSQMMKLKKAKLFVHSGLDGEAWAPLLIKGSRNADLLPGRPGNVDVSRGISLKEVPGKGQLTRALGDIHVFGNPHYALDPMNVVIIARTITDALQHAEPRFADEFEANYKRYADRMRELDKRLVARMKPFHGTPVVTYHRTWPYFLDRFGLVSIGEVEPKPGITPGPGYLSECVERMKARGAKVVIVETFNSLQNAQSVAQRAGGKAIVLAQEVRAVPKVDTYEKLFTYNIDQLTAAFKEVGVQRNGSEQ